MFRKGKAASVAGTLQARMRVVQDLVGEVGKHTSCGVVLPHLFNVHKNCQGCMLNQRCLSPAPRDGDLNGV